MKNTFTALLVGVAALGLGLGLAFGGGVLYGRETADPPKAPAVVTTAAGGGAASGLTSSGAGGLRTGAGGGIAGVVEKVEGNTVTIRTQQGTTNVLLAADTELRQTAGAQVTDLKAGQTITVTGAGNADGTYQARTVTIAPAGGGGQGQGSGGPAAGATGTPGARRAGNASPTPSR